MCGIAGIFGKTWRPDQLRRMVEVQRHRGPDGEGIYLDPNLMAGMGHNRLKIIDLSEAGRQPMFDVDGRFCLVFNGEIYNYLELRRELESSFSFRTRTDTEVLLAAYQRWGTDCLDRLIGMFAFAIWDEQQKKLFAARDRFGVKPLYYHQTAGGDLLIASEIKALHAAGLDRVPDETTWANYLVHGLTDHEDRTFWQGIRSLPGGHYLEWHDGHLRIHLWYDVAQRSGRDFDSRSVDDVEEEYRVILNDSVTLRFRSDVPVGINLSGGLDSSTLLGLVHAYQGADSDVKAFTFYTGDERYDELPWVRRMLEQTNHQLIASRITAAEVPSLADSVQSHQDEPFGGLPTLAYANLFAEARSLGVIVLLDGQGMDEQWAGYDYYASGAATSVVQGTKQKPTRPECLTSDLCSLAETFVPESPFADELRNLQYRDIRNTKIPRALRFNDRISMRSSTELREPFLDHRLIELALRQPSDRKIQDGTSKWLLRRLSRKLAPENVVEAPKRPLQTPQREWLRGPLREWATAQIEQTLSEYGGSWFNSAEVRGAWQSYCAGASDNSFYVWQWISMGLLMNREVLAGV